MARDESPGELPEVGLCSLCRHARRLHNARGSDFWQCLAAASDPSLPRYPRLPVERCRAFERAEAPRSRPE
jgi:hypothetical protein